MLLKIKIKSERDLEIPPLRPSGELWMHWNLLKDAKTTTSVLHLHPTYCVAAMYKGWQLNDIVKDFPEVFRYTRTGPNVPKLEATSQDLADQTYKKFLGKDGKIAYDIVGQECHGVTAIAKNPWDAFEHIERVEHICKIVLAAS